MDTWQLAVTNLTAPRAWRPLQGRFKARSSRADAAVGALGLQFAVLYAPRAPGIATRTLPVDKLVHIAVFALPTAALIAAGVPRGWVIGLMAAHAPLSEGIQGSLLADRSAERGDVVADLAGVLLGALLARPPDRIEEKMRVVGRSLV